MIRKEIDERMLVERVLQGDGQAAREMYTYLSSRLEAFFYEKTTNSQDTQELVQDTFLHILDALPLFRFQSSLLTFALSIAYHEAADYWRKRYAKRAVKTVPVLKEMPASPYASEATSLAMHEAVEKAYRSLKPVQAQLLRWKYEEGKSVKEMAGSLGWTGKAVEAQLYRARKAFQLAYVAPNVYE